jgi:4-aminobutyrate aminotransferase-like enzyme
MVLDHGYHGNTRLGIDISHYKFGRKGGKGQANYIVRAPIPDIYRGAYTEEESAGRDYAMQARGLLEQSPVPVAAFIAEPIVGCAGQVPLARDYLKNIYPMIRKQGGLCISDEVQTGFGRVGSVFWGYELQKVVPDIVVLGKPMGNGHPLAAVVTTDAVARSFDNGMEFFSSFGGNTVSCAIGMAVLDVIEEEGLQANALHTGNHFMKLLRQLMLKYEQIGNVRGHGLFIGVEFVTDRTSKGHNGKLAGMVKNMLRDRFVLVSTDGPENNIIKMKPPLCFTAENAQTVVEHMDEILGSEKVYP